MLKIPNVQMSSSGLLVLGFEFWFLSIQKRKSGRGNMEKVTGVKVQGKGSASFIGHGALFQRRYNLKRFLATKA